MRRFNFTSQYALFSAAVYTSVIAKRRLGTPFAIDFITHNSVKLLGNIHDAHFTGEFSDTDVENLRSDLAKSTNNYYKLLDIDPKLEKSIFKRELKQKYRALSLRFHPDCTTGHAAKTEIFKLVKNAYEKLSNLNFRDDYDFSLDGDIEIDKHFKKFFISKCGNIAAALSSNCLVIFDAKTKTLLHKFLGTYYGAHASFSADSKKIVLCDRLSLKILTIETSRWIIEKVVPYEYTLGFNQAMLRLSNGNFVSTSEYGSLEIWDGQTGQHIRTLTGHSKYVMALSLIPNSNCIISGSWDSTMKVWDMDTGNCVHTISLSFFAAEKISLSADAKYLVAGGCGGNFTIWDFESKKLIKESLGYTWNPGGLAQIKGIFISPDSSYFAIILDTPTVKIWEMESGKQVGEKNLSARPASVSNFGENIFISFDDGTIREFTFSNFQYDCMHAQQMTPLMPGK